MRKSFNVNQCFSDKMKLKKIIAVIILTISVASYSQSEIRYNVLEHNSENKVKFFELFQVTKIDSLHSLGILNNYKSGKYYNQELQLIDNRDNAVVKTTFFSKFKISDAKVINNVFYIFGRDKFGPFYTCEFDIKNFSCIKEKKLLEAPNIKKDLKNLYPDPTIILSDNKNKIGIIQKAFDKEKKITYFEVKVYDNNFNLLSEKRINGKKRTFFLKISSALISNEGEVFLSFKPINDLIITKDEVYGQNNHVTNYNKKPAYYHDPFIKGETICYYSFISSKKDKTLELKNNVLNKDLKLIDSSSIILDSDYNGHLTIIREVKKLNNGSELIIMEEVSPPINTIYAYRNIHLYIINSKGKNIQKIIIEKEQITERRYGSFAYMLIDNVLHIIYNKNGKKRNTSFVVNSINIDTGEKTYQEIFNVSNLGFLPIGRHYYKLDNNSLVLYTNDPNKRVQIVIN